MIEIQGGKIWAQSVRKDKGSVFAFTLPVAEEGSEESDKIFQEKTKSNKSKREKEKKI